MSYRVREPSIAVRPDTVGTVVESVDDSGKTELRVHISARETTDVSSAESAGSNDARDDSS